MERILVTGGAGYVGSHTVHHLVQNGVEPSTIVVLDNFSQGHRDALPDGVVVVEGDLRRAVDLETAFAGRDIGSVVHFAGLAYVGESMEQPGRYFETNVGGGLALLEAMRAHDCRRIVFSSTCSIYGVPERVPIPEDHPLAPINPYGESKRMFERILAWYGAIHAIKSISLRYFNAAGAGYGIGERHEPETHAIPLLLDSALGRREPFSVLGIDHPTKDGSCIRDYIHVVDLARAHALALDRLRSATPTAEIFNLGTGVGTSVLELIGLVEQLVGHHVDYRTAPRRPGDPPVLVASSARARDALGWAASNTIRDILADALAWHRR